MTFVLPFPNIDPALLTVDVFGLTLSLRWYALAYIAGLFLAWRTAVWLTRRPALWPGDTAPVAPERLEDLLSWMALGVVLGGRLGFVLFYQPAYYLAHPAEIIEIWNGGMSFHGGFLGVIVAGAIWCRATGAPMASVGDAVAVGAPLGLLFGRLANFVNGELWGRPTDVPWAMIFPGSDGAPRHPSQLYQAALEGLFLFAILWLLATRARWLKTPGAIIGAFFALYGAARVIAENFRQGDAIYVSADNPAGHALRFGDSVDAFGMTMGQILSFPMIAIGLGIIFAVRRGARA